MDRKPDYWRSAPSVQMLFCAVKQLITTKQAALLGGVPLKVINEAISCRHLSGFRLGEAGFRIERSKLDRWKLGYIEQVHPSTTKKSLYLLKDRATGLYKIGISNRPGFRERTLQSQSPKIVMVGQWPSLGFLEKQLHERYAAQRVRGEWFTLSKSQIRYLCYYICNASKSIKTATWKTTL